MSERKAEVIPPADDAPSPERREFLGRIGKAAVAATAIGAAAPFVSDAASSVSAQKSVGPDAAPSSRGRIDYCFNYRRNMAIIQRVDVGPQPDNGDMAAYPDFSGNFSKTLLHSSLGIPDHAAWLSLRTAMLSGSQTDFANIIVGTPGGGENSRLNGPQGAIAFDLEGRDSHGTVIPAAPTVAGAQTAAEQVEVYWASLMADVPFTQYATDPIAGQAVADLNSMSFYASAANDQCPFPITRQNLFRGKFLPGDGNVLGPYVSQLMLQPTFYGAQPLSQRYQTFLPIGGGGTDYMTTVGEYQLVQNGGDSGRPIAYDPTYRHIRNGRDLAAFTRVDVLYQAYFTAFLVLAGLGAAPNPGNPYNSSLTQKAFGTLGGPDAAGTLAEMATRALKAAWFHKWIKDMRLRPEELGALVHARKTNASPMPLAAAALHADVLNSAVLPIIHAAYGTYLMPVRFPEGSPTHPCYPTGHGTVGGACTTLLKFFFDGSQQIRPLLTAAGRDVYEASTDGLSLNTYTGGDANTMDINGELNKLAYNITFGHGIHSGIHFRSSSYWAILLGEQVALHVLKDRAKSYNEPFTISIKKFDGTTAVITNQ